MHEEHGPLSRFDTGVAHPARRYNYWLGGTENFAADRASGDAFAAAFPTIRDSVRENRRFLARTVRFLAAEAGVGQFLDIGSGLPDTDNTHQVAQRSNPHARVLYVDNDPIVLAHAAALQAAAPETGTHYLEADLRQPERILEAGTRHGVLDPRRPVGLIMLAVLHFIRDFEDPYGLVTRMTAALPAGSYLVISHATDELLDRATVEELDRQSDGQWRQRSRAEIARFFTGLDLVEPGVVPIGHWRPEPGSVPPDPARIILDGGVARIP
ncbi:SAM-dependent methyltransferase [Dactylosporangium sp. NPDC051541]|uniref:SAM-dependent methyltransferase n=1 Tax=Dactylosporangium sp. NPDC051541 TaxID=3363977 RepID=UPI0037B119FC